MLLYSLTLSANILLYYYWYNQTTSSCQISDVSELLIFPPLASLRWFHLNIILRLKKWNYPLFQKVIAREKGPNWTNLRSRTLFFLPPGLINHLMTPGDSYWGLTLMWGITLVKLPTFTTYNFNHKSTRCKNTKLPVQQCRSISQY